MGRVAFWLSIALHSNKCARAASNPVYWPRMGESAKGQQVKARRKGRASWRKTAGSRHPLILLNDAIRPVVGHTLVLLNQFAVLSEGGQFRSLTGFHLAKKRLLVGRHGERARGEKGKCQAKQQLAFHEGYSPEGHLKNMKRIIQAHFPYKTSSS
jgi:hypothetical protein